MPYDGAMDDDDELDALRERWDEARTASDVGTVIAAAVALYAACVDAFEEEEAADVLDEALARTRGPAEELDLRVALADALDRRFETREALEQLRSAYALARSATIDPPRVVRVCRRLAASLDATDVEQLEAATTGLAAAEAWLIERDDRAVALDVVELHLVVARRGDAGVHGKAAMDVAARHGLRVALLDAAQVLASAHVDRGERVEADAVLERVLPEARACATSEERFAALRVVALRNEVRRGRGLDEEPPEALLGPLPVEESSSDSPPDEGLERVTAALTRHATAAEAAVAGAFEPVSYVAYGRLADAEQLGSEALFGPRRDYECACGRYRGRAYAGLVCERCRVELIPSSARATRCAYVRLPRRVLHPWYRADAALLLGISEGALARLSPDELDGRLLDVDLGERLEAHDGSPRALLCEALVDAFRALSRGAAALMIDELPVPPPDADLEGRLGVEPAALRRAYEAVLAASEEDLDAAVAAFFACIDASERVLPPGPDVPELVLADVRWRQSDALFATKEDFVRAVEDYARRIRSVASWHPDEVVLRAPAIRIAFRCWSGQRELWPVRTIAAPNGASFTSAELLYAVTQAIATELRATHAELYDHCFFEGLSKDSRASDIPLYHVLFGS